MLDAVPRPFFQYSHVLQLAFGSKLDQLRLAINSPQNSRGNLLDPRSLDSLAIFTNLYGVPMPTFVTGNTKRNQVIRCIMTKLTPRS